MSISARLLLHVVHTKNGRESNISNDYTQHIPVGLNCFGGGHWLFPLQGQPHMEQVAAQMRMAACHPPYQPPHVIALLPACTTQCKYREYA